MLAPILDVDRVLSLKGDPSRPQFKTQGILVNALE